MTHDPRPAPAAAAVDWDDQAAALAQLKYAALHEKLGIEIDEIRPERVVGRMPVEGNTQPYGMLHGGASCVLAEGLGSIAATTYAAPEAIAFGIEINATHHRAAQSGWVTGVATPLHLGRTLVTYEIVITDEQDQRICTARLTCALRPRRD